MLSAFLSKTIVSFVWNWIFLKIAIFMLMVIILKFRTLFSFCYSNKMLVTWAGIHKMLVRMVNREDPDQTASSEAV